MKSRHITAGLIVTVSIFVVSVMVSRAGSIHPDIA